MHIKKYESESKDLCAQDMRTIWQYTSKKTASLIYDYLRLLAILLDYLKQDSKQTSDKIGEPSQAYMQNLCFKLMDWMR
jgi:hypothetical protein